MTEQNAGTAPADTPTKPTPQTGDVVRVYSTPDAYRYGHRQLLCEYTVVGGTADKLECTGTSGGMVGDLTAPQWERMTLTRDGRTEFVGAELAAQGWGTHPGTGATRYPVVHEAPSQYSTHWTPTTEPPNHNGPVWCFLPEIGNEEDGYGHVEVGQAEYNGMGTRRRWVNSHRQEIEPTLWCYITEVAAPYTTPQRPGGGA